MSICIFVSAALVSFTPDNNTAPDAAILVKEGFLNNLSEFNKQTSVLIQTLESLSQHKVTLQQAQKEYYRTKQYYKKIEYLLEYLDPELGKSLNGAPIPRVVVEHQDYLTLGFKAPTHVSFTPEGLQVIEELIFSGAVTPEDIKKGLVLSYRLQEKTTQFLGNLQAQPLTDKQIFNSMREQLVRVVTMGLTGFDSPAAGNEMQNVALSLEPVLSAVQLYGMDATGAAAVPVPASSNLLSRSINYLQQNPEFESFNRLYFIREFADPVYAALTDVEAKILSGNRSSAGALTAAVNNQAKSIFSASFLQPGYYAKEDRVNQKAPILLLGKTLFFDPVLSANNQRACASCHVPAKAFTDGRTKSIAFNDQGTVARNSPTLLNAVFSKGYFWDNRAQFLQDQVPGVLTKSDELHGAYEEVVQKLNLSNEYRQLFRSAFKNLPAHKAINTNTINRALAAYIQTLVALNSPFDKYMRRETEVIPAAVERGFNLFMGKAACGTCHFAPVFNGTVPPRYLESETEVLGITATADLKNPVLDADPGRAGFIKADALYRSFKTPTVRNAALTGPYMHNGAFTSLPEVLEFYNQGGGAGLGLDVPNQTLPAKSLDLTGAEKNDIISFLEALTDTTLLNVVPKRLPQFPTKTGLNNRPIGGRY